MLGELAIFKSVRTFLSRGVSEPPPGTSAPEDPKALKSRGNELLGQGKLAEAVACYGRVVELTPLDALAHINLGYGLLELGKLDAARQSLLTARQLDGQLVDAHFLLGQVFDRQKLPQEATQSFQAALAVKPDFDFAWFELARMHEQLDDLPAALDDYSRVLALNSDFLGAVNGEVRVLLGLERWSDALERIDGQLASGPTDDFTIFRARALHGLEKYEEALSVLNGFLETHPEDVNALHGKARTLISLEQFPQALELYRRVLVLEPGFVEALTNAGTVCDRLGRHQDAMEFHEKAAALAPDDAIVLRNMGTALMGLGRYQEIVSVMDHALKHHPGHADLHWHKAWACLLLGDLRQGWPGYEWRWDITSSKPKPPRPVFSVPQWTGQPLAGKTIFVYLEQGLGDTIQMLRYVPLLAERGASILLLVQPAVVPLCDDLQGLCTLIEEIGARHFDYHCPLLSLPFGFDTLVETIPSPQPYLRSDPELRAQWEDKLGPRNAPRIGLVWSGSTEHQNDESRSMPLQVLVDGLPQGLKLVSLQKEVRAPDVPVLQGKGIFHAGEALRSFADTAALADCMDLVISVDTSVAHLAGALGRPVWILLPQRPDWRWVVGRDDSPWYGSARLFRQKEARNWQEVVARVSAELTRMFQAAVSAP